MALDDFLSEETEPAEPLELPPEDAASDAAAAGSSEAFDDDDLFDLRTLDEIDELVADAVAEETAGGASTASIPAAPEPEAPEVVAAAPDTPALVATEPAPVAPDEPTAPPAGGDAADEPFDLDEDLFDFGSPGDEHLDSLVSLGNDLAEILSEVGPAPDPEELTELAEATAFDVDALEREAALLDQRDGAAGERETAPAAAAAAAAAATGAPVAAIDPRLVRSRPSWPAVLAVIAANFTLLYFAWSASRSLHDHLGEVRQELRQRAALDAAAAHEAVVRAPAPGQALVAEPAEEAPAPRPVTLPRLPAAESMELSVAEREIADERFGDARLRLYRLLAVADALEADARATVERRALFLIGDTYARQAALGEGRP